MPQIKKLTLLMAKVEASRGMGTEAGSTSTLIDTNQTWLADGVEVGDRIIIKTFTAGSDGEHSFITNINDGTDTITFSSPLLSGATADGDIYEIIVAGGLVANVQDLAITGTADAGSDSTTIIDAALNTNDGFAHQGVEVGNQVYITGGGGVEGSAIITAINHGTDTFTIAPAITGVTTDSTFVIRPKPVLLFDVSHTATVEQYDRAPYRASLTRLPAIMGKRSSQIVCKLELAGGTTYANYAAGTPGAGELPAYHDYIKALGFEETVVASTSVIYTPLSTGVPALTIATYEDGIEMVSSGCRGTGVFSLVTGQPAMIDITYSGIPVEVSSSLIKDTPYPKGIIYPGIVPPTCLGVTIDAYSAIIENMSFDLGGTVAYRTSMAASAGNVSTLITDRNFTGSFDPEMVKKATHDFWGKMINGTLVEISATLGSVAGNTIQIGSPDGTTTGQYVELAQADRVGVTTLGCNYKMVSAQDESEFAIKIF